MPENPLKTSDIFQDDGVLQKVIDQLKELKALVLKMEGAYVESAKSIQGETQGMASAQKAHQKELVKNAQKVDALTKANEKLQQAKGTVGKELAKLKIAQEEQVKLNRLAVKLEKEQAFATDKTAQSIAALKAETTKLTKVNQLNQKQAAAQKGSFDELSATYAKLKLEINAMSAAERFNTEAGREKVALSKQIYSEMAQMQVATGQHTLKVGSYTEAIEQANMGLGEMRQMLKALRKIPIDGMAEAEVKDLDMAIGKLNDNMMDLQHQQQALGMDTFELITGATRAATASVQGLAAAFNVLGIESKLLKGVQQNMMDMIAITQALAAIEEVYQRKLVQSMAIRVKSTVVGWKDVAVRKAQALSTWLQIKAIGAQTVATVGATGATVAAAKATTAWGVAVQIFSKAVYKIPVIGWLLGALALIIAALTAIVVYWDKVTNVFVSLGKWLGIVKQTRGELRSLQAEVALYNRQLANEQKLQSNREKTINRQLNLMKAQGAAVDDIREKERLLLNTQIKSAEAQVGFAAIAYRLKQQQRRATEEELLAAQQAYEQAKEALSELRHQSEIMDAEDKTAAEQRRQQRRVDAAEQRRAEDERRREEEATRNENQKAQLEFNILRATNEKEHLEAQIALIRFNGELQRAEMEKNSNLYLLSLEKQNQEEAALRKDALDNWMQKEEGFTELLMELRNSEETKELTALRRTYEEKLKLVQEFGEGEVELNEWYESETLRITGEYAAKRNDLELEEFDRQQEFAEGEFLTVKRTEAEKTRFRLEAEKQRWEKILEIALKSQGPYTEQEIQHIRNLIKQVDVEMEGLGEGEQRDIWDLLGIELGEEEKGAIAASTDLVISHIRSVADERVDAANRVVNATQKEVDAARKALDEQKKLTADGYASDEASAREALDAAEERSKIALKRQEEAQKKQEKLRSLEQVANMIVASSEVIKKFNFPLAIPVLALMWGTFIAQKRKARQVAAERYGKGHYELIDTGGSHASGQDTPLGIDDRNRRVERGEAFAVFRKEAVSKYGNALHGMIKMANNLELEKATGDLVKMSNLSIKNEFSTKDLEKGISTLVEQGYKRTYVDNKGRMVVEHNNVKKVYV